MARINIARAERALAGSVVSSRRNGQGRQTRGTKDGVSPRVSIAFPQNVLNLINDSAEELEISFAQRCRDLIALGLRAEHEQKQTQKRRKT